MSRSMSQTSSTDTTSGLGRSLSVKTNAKTTTPSQLPRSTTSDVKLFVTNLRLLNFDLRSDWPNITVQTFSAKNADQKQRMGAVEWSLFRLFEIWDPVETSQKLQPFFPPLEPLQAKNLRNALYRALDTLKKDGVLGRETVLRKTMLDECKGEKFFEILAIFSNMVLKKVLASRPTEAPMVAVTRRLATASQLSLEQQQSLIPLAIAHKAALVDVLKRKEEKRRRFAQFKDLLDAKATEINQRIRQCKETPRARKPAVSQKEADAIKKQLKDNWIGNQQWLDIMLHGDDVQTEAAFLSTSFPKVWRMVEQGRRLEDAVPDTGLLENLQSRVEEQRARLQKWQDFHDTLQKGESFTSDALEKKSAPAKEFRFDDHLKLQLRSEIPAKEIIQRPSLRPEYHEIVAELDDELAHIASSKFNISTLPPTRRRGSSLNTSKSPVRRRASRSDSAPKVPKLQASPRPQPSRKQSHKTQSHRATHDREPLETPADSDATLVGQPSTVRSASPNPLVEHSPVEQESELGAIGPTSDPLPAATSPPCIQQPIDPPSPSPSPPPRSSYFPSEPPVLEAATEDALAAQIISTIGEATPSPVKKPQPRLSLMERTRLSMNPHAFPSIPESPPTLPSPALPEDPTPAPDPQASLIERTRLSMAAMSARPRQSLAPKTKRKSSARTSLFPVNQFDTPRGRKSFVAIEEAKESGQKTPKEDLFSDEVDYDRVFKSRPRIATSPVWGTPEAGGGAERDAEEEYEEEFDEGVTGVDLADVDNEEDGDVSAAWEDSPLRGAGRRPMFR